MALAAALPAYALAATQISEVRLAVAHDHTQIVFEASQPIKTVLFSLRNPERAILDLEGVALNSVLATLGDRIGADHPFIKVVRIESSDAGKVRVELDFKGEIYPGIFSQKPEGKYGYRVVLDLYTTGAAKRDTPHEEKDRDTAEASSDPEEMWLDVRINGQKPMDTALLLRRHDGRLLASIEDLRRWRLRMPDIEPVMYMEEKYVLLDALRGLSYRIDETSQTIELEAIPGLFSTTEIQGRPSGFVQPAPSSPGGILNYDLHVSHAENRRTASGLFELGAFGGTDVATSTFAYREREEGAALFRLDTSWRKDNPAALSTMLFGDGITGAGSWGRSVRFGGIQWRRNFATQPGIVTMPQPGLAGEAALPSTVELFVNNALRMRREVPAGPFSIQSMPVVTGHGEARMIVRDMLGREQVITRPYYASARLLLQGLHDYSYELGAVRENYGKSSNDYGRLFVSGTHRFGMTDRFTGELHGQVLRDQQMAGVGGTMLLFPFGTVSAALAASRSEAGMGGLLSLGMEGQAGPLNFGATSQMATESFVQLGSLPEEIASRQVSHVLFAGLSAGRYGSFGMSYTRQDRYGQDSEDGQELLTANYSVGLGNLGSLTLSLLRSLGEEQGTSVAIHFTRSLGNRTNASSSATLQKQHRTQSQVQLQRSLPAGNGIGYGLLAGSGQSNLLRASVSLQNDVGLYSVEASRLQGRSGIQASASGGVALLDGEVFMGRRIGSSFAVVRVPDHPGVRVYADNQLVAQTGTKGSAFVPSLRAYEKNTIRIEQADLPMDVQIDSLQTEAVPYHRSGLGLTFKIKRSNGGLLTVLLDDGEPIPSGAVAQLVGTKEEFPVAERGELYMTGLEPTNRIQVTWRGSSCELTVPFPESDDPLPDLGSYTCTGVKR